jgi:biopolymer transport protein ExbB/TolQ
MKINKKLILLVQVINFLILAKINNAISSSSSRNSHTEDLLDRIALNNNNNNNNNDKSSIKYGGQDEINKNLARFLNKIIPTFSTTQKDNACNSKVLQSNVQSKMRTLRSIISSCPGYCRLAMSLNGRLYGSRNDFGLESRSFILFFKNMKSTATI